MYVYIATDNDTINSSLSPVVSPIPDIYILLLY